MLKLPITNFTRDYFYYDSKSRTKILASRWHFDLNKFSNGPIMVEEFIDHTGRRTISDHTDKKKRKDLGSNYPD